MVSQNVCIQIPLCATQHPEQRKSVLGGKLICVEGLLLGIRLDDFKNESSRIILQLRKMY